MPFNRRFLDFAHDAADYPNPLFERWYQQGLDCYLWGLPEVYIKQAYRAAHHGTTPSYWQKRAFIHGLQGGAFKPARRVSADYRWPTPPTASWLTLICRYPDGKIDLDFAHPVSRVFWSEENPCPRLPDGILCYQLERLGFEIMQMIPIEHAAIQMSPAPRHLSLV